jgi:hypothetical protein
MICCPVLVFRMFRLLSKLESMAVSFYLETVVRDGKRKRDWWSNIWPCVARDSSPGSLCCQRLPTILSQMSHE